MIAKAAKSMDAFDLVSKERVNTLRPACRSCRQSSGCRGPRTRSGYWDLRPPAAAGGRPGSMYRARFGTHRTSWSTQAGRPNYRAAARLFFCVAFEVYYGMPLSLVLEDATLGHALQCRVGVLWLHATVPCTSSIACCRLLATHPLQTDAQEQPQHHLSSSTQPRRAPIGFTLFCAPVAVPEYSIGAGGLMDT